MLLLSADVFDEFIVGTNPTWYSYAQFNQTLGAADSLSVMAYFTNASGTTPRIQLFSDHSVDGRTWALGTTVLVSSTKDIFSGLLMYGAWAPSGSIGLTSPGAVTRLRLKLTGTNPQCRLKLTATGRSL